MKKQILFSLALLVAVSCVPVQAAQDKSTWTVFKNSAKILIGSLFVFKCSIMPTIDAVAFDKEAALVAAEQQHQASLAEARQRGGHNLEYRIYNINSTYGSNRAIIEGRGTLGILDLCVTAGGIALIYSGYKGLTEQEESVKA
jgi:hypothetical protein